MFVQIILRSKNDPSYYIEQEFFNPEEINIGSGDSNHIILQDPNNKVAHNHAQIVIDRKNYYLIDKGSNHGTYIQGKKVTANAPIPITNEIEFTIGEFDVTLTIDEQDTQYSDESILEGNPFDEDMRILSSTFNRLIHRYNLLNIDQKQTFLIQAFRDMIIEDGDNDIFHIFIKTLGEQKYYQLNDLSKPLVKLLDALLEAFKKLLEMHTQFRALILGESTECDSKAIDSNSVDALKKYLLQPDITYKESQARFNELYNELETLIMHQSALLDGYRFGVREGSIALLKEVDPRLYNEADKGNRGSVGWMTLPHRWISSLFKIKVLGEVNRKHIELRKRGKQYIEEHFFREPFREHYCNSFQRSELSEDFEKTSGGNQPVRK